MTPTSEERRVVAERLREYGNDTLKDGSLLKTLKDVTGAGSWRYVLDALADLIDPTCYLLPSFDGGFGCDRCCTWFPSMKEKPRFCPECGARVVDEDGD